MVRRSRAGASIQARGVDTPSCRRLQMSEIVHAFWAWYTEEGTLLAHHELVELVVGEAGIEPTTPGLEGRCSIQLSYSPTSPYCSFAAAVSAEAPDVMESAKAAKATASTWKALRGVGPQAVTYAVIPNSVRSGGSMAWRTTRSARQQRIGQACRIVQIFLHHEVVAADVAHC